MWDEIVRPAVKLLLDITVVAFVKWALGWSIEVPKLLRDYVSVGLVFFFSSLRTDVTFNKQTLVYQFSGLWHYPANLLISLAAWPFF